MNITLFSGNQPRHLNLAARLSQTAEAVFFISECTTVFPGKIEDFYKKSEIMLTYFNRVMAAEQKIFGGVNFTAGNIRTLPLKAGDLNFLSAEDLRPALSSDLYIVFGASWIKGWLVDFLIGRNAVNIHMGVSPYYRGSSCNFWALYDRRPGYVGATIHKLSKGLDSGDMLCHCLPSLKDGDTPFDFTMRAVEAAHTALFEKAASGKILNMKTVKQDKSLEVRYSRANEFTDEVAEKFLQRNDNLEIAAFDYPELLNPVFG